MRREDAKTVKNKATMAARSNARHLARWLWTICEYVVTTKDLLVALHNRKILNEISLFADFHLQIAIHCDNTSAI